jgi:hypothetical protein
MGDPVMQSILQQAQTNPAALQDHMKNPIVRDKINKLSVRVSSGRDKLVDPEPRGWSRLKEYLARRRFVSVYRFDVFFPSPVVRFSMLIIGFTTSIHNLQQSNDEVAFTADRISKRGAVSWARHEASY